ncbi:hypothetical protein HYR54_12935 [Candidatus Acetothermia bacterium]|nr:hypothetical protein [Candidatus Acetothermia bacterium]
MYTTIRKQWVVRMILAGLAVGVLDFSVNAQQMEIMKQPQPRDFIWREFVAGNVGALAGGMIGLRMFTAVLRPLLDPPYCKSLQAFALSDERCHLSERIAWVLGSSLGTSLTVISTGSYFGVRGNIAMTFLAAIVGNTLGAWTIIFLIPQIALTPIMPLVFAAIIPAAFATAGFNLGARMDLSADLFYGGLELGIWRTQW